MHTLAYASEVKLVTLDKKIPDSCPIWAGQQLELFRSPYHLRDFLEFFIYMMNIYGPRAWKILKWAVVVSDVSSAMRAVFLHCYCSYGNKKKRAAMTVGTTSVTKIVNFTSLARIVHAENNFVEKGCSWAATVFNPRFLFFEA